MDEIRLILTALRFALCSWLCAAFRFALRASRLLDSRAIAEQKPPREFAVVSTSTNDVVGQNQNRESASWTDVVKLSGQLIGAVERSVTASGNDFDSLFRGVRLGLADDYSFFDPFVSRFQYSNSVVSLTDPAPVKAYVTGLSEALRRLVNKVATGDRGRRVRERVAVELAMVARPQRELLQRTGFDHELERIAGAKVI